MHTRSKRICGLIVKINKWVYKITVYKYSIQKPIVIATKFRKWNLKDLIYISIKMWDALEKISHRFARHRKLYRMTLKMMLRSGEMYQIYGFDNSELYHADCSQTVL